MLELSVEHFKLVILIKYEIESLDVLIENTFVIFSRTGIESKKTYLLTGQCWDCSRRVVKTAKSLVLIPTKPQIWHKSKLIQSVSKERISMFSGKILRREFFDCNRKRIYATLYFFSYCNVELASLSSLVSNI